MAKKTPKRPPQRQAPAQAPEVLPPVRGRGGKRVGSGRKRFSPSPEQRQIVKAAAGIGLRRSQIAQLVIVPATGEPLGETALREHFRAELRAGKAQAHFNVGKSLYDQAVGIPKMSADGQRQVGWVAPPVPACTIWFTKSQMGFHEQLKFDAASFQNFIAAIGGNVAALRAVRASIPAPED